MEHYITIKDYPNFEVSNLGNVRNKVTGTVRKLTDLKGYRKVRLGGKDQSVHRLVADAFFDGCHDGLQVNHLDGNKANNHISNLRWVTPSENVKHAFDTGLKHGTGGCPSKKIIDRDSGEVYDSMKACARALGGTNQGVKYAVEHTGHYKGHNLGLYGDDSE